MKIKITDTTVANGKNVYVGDEVEVSKSDGKLLIRMGKAVEVESSTAEPAAENEKPAAPKKKAGERSVPKRKK